MKTKPILDHNTEIDWDGQPWTDREFSHPERTVRIGTAFSGIGSPEMALQELGVKHEIVFACDIDKHAKASYFANYPIKEENWYDDITTFDASIYKDKVDIFIGGVCCQSWSLSGKLAGFADPRGRLFDDFIRVICECQPKIWIFENVENLFHHNGGKSWSTLHDDILSQFKKTGIHYDLHWRVLNSADYGVPQNRERAFCIGFQEKTDFKFPAPILLKKDTRDYLDDKTPCYRLLTARERIRMMGFPDSFKQVVSSSQFSKQAGNSIVVDVMKALYKQMDITKYGIEK